MSCDADRYVGDKREVRFWACSRLFGAGAPSVGYTWHGCLANASRRPCFAGRRVRTDCPDWPD